MLCQTCHTSDHAKNLYSGANLAGWERHHGEWQYPIGKPEPRSAGKCAQLSGLSLNHPRLESPSRRQVPAVTVQGKRLNMRISTKQSGCAGRWSECVCGEIVACVIFFVLAGIGTHAYSQTAPATPTAAGPPAAAATTPSAASQTTPAKAAGAGSIALTHAPPTNTHWGRIGAEHRWGGSPEGLTTPIRGGGEPITRMRFSLSFPWRIRSQQEAPPRASTPT
jgi:hypothetical protein